MYELLIKVLLNGNKNCTKNKQNPKMVPSISMISPLLKLIFIIKYVVGDKL